MNRYPSSLGQYLAWLFQKYQELKQEMPLTDTYRIIDKLDSPADAPLKFKIQIIGTDKTVNWSPEYIVKNDQLLQGFSKLDIRTITYYACEEINKPKLTILSHSFSDKLKKIIFRVKDRKANQIIEKSASHFLQNNDFVNQLSQQDALRVGYVGATEAADREKDTLEKFKEKNTENIKNT